MKSIILPEFDQSKRIDSQQAFMFDSACYYDVIFGKDFLTKIGMEMSFKEGTMSWFDQQVKINWIWPM